MGGKSIYFIHSQVERKLMEKVNPYFFFITNINLLLFTEGKSYTQTNPYLLNSVRQRRRINCNNLLSLGKK